jgi:hypothetical protein
MTLTELQAAVIEITNRPDLVAKTLSAVQSATLKAHHSDYYHKDIYEAEIDFTTEAYEPDFEYRTFVPRWRAAKYFRKYDHANAVPGMFFEKISPENALDSYAQAQTNVWYGAGEIIHLKSSTEIRYILMGCYRHPDITVDDFDSWIAVDHPYAIVYAAAQTIFRTIGKTEEMRAMKEEVGEQMILLRNANVVEEGE